MPHFGRFTPLILVRSHNEKSAPCWPALLIGLSGAVNGAKQEPAKPAAAPAAAPAAKARCKPATCKGRGMKPERTAGSEFGHRQGVGRAAQDWRKAKGRCIIRGRPWGGKDELVAKKILAQAEYDAIR